jgi:glyoxylase-like metal-dependent hydrolase (beta-lactamase superfamily II)
MDIITLKLSVTHCFLLKTKEGYVLIDTGYEADWELFRRRLQEAGVEFSQLRQIILTHHHDDHAGLLNLIVKENPRIQVVMSRCAKELLARGENDAAHPKGVINRRVRLLLTLKRFIIMLTLKKYVPKNRNLKFPPYEVRPNDILISGETRLEAIGIGLKGRIIKTPGHTIDSLSVLLDDGDTLVGDAAANMLRFAGTKYCVIGVSDLDEYYRSWQRLIAAGAKRIMPAHGKPFPVDKLIANMGRNKKQNMVMVSQGRMEKQLR